MTCLWCEGEFTPTQRGGRPQKYCSSYCRMTAFAADEAFKKGHPLEKRCEHCTLTHVGEC